MATMKPTSFKIGYVSVRPLMPGKWQIRYTDPVTSLEVKRRVSGTQEEIKAVASNLHGECLAGRGYLAGQRKVPSLSKMIEDAIRLSPGADKHKLEMAYHAARWIKWMKNEYPKVQSFADLRPHMLQAYVRQLEKSGKAFDTVRLATVPVKLCWRFAYENYPEDVRPMPRVRQAARPRRKIICLEADDIQVLLDWLKTKAVDIYPMALLQTFCGLRVLEAAAVRRQDIDAQHGLLRVTDTEIHRLKTACSERTIPIPSFVTKALVESMNRQRVIPVSGCLFLTTKGTPWTLEALQSRWTRLRKALVKETRNQRYKQVPPKRLRSSFATMASRLGVTDRLLKAYMGHSSGDILGTHYRVIDPGELRSVSAAMEDWETLVKGEVARKESGNSSRCVPVSD